MIVNKVSALMGARRENIKQMAQASGVSYGTAYSLYKGTTTRIDFETLNRLCRHFGVGTSELLQYVPDPAE